MSSCIDDLRSSAEVLVSLFPTAVTATGSGNQVDFIDGDGPCFAIQTVGDAADNTTLDGSLEESADGTTWSAIAGASFAEVAEANDVQVLTFQRTKRYVRWTGTVAGTSPSFTVAVLIGDQKKSF